jgi:hypothetical protein
LTSLCSSRTLLSTRLATFPRAVSWAPNEEA